MSCYECKFFDLVNWMCENPDSEHYIEGRTPYSAACFDIELDCDVDRDIELDCDVDRTELFT